jgi:hypothetical protein
MKKARRNLLSRGTLGLLGLALMSTMMVGCGSTVSGRSAAYNGRWWRTNLRNHWYVIERDATDLYRSIDRHFFNYDWDDPYLED